VLTTRQAVLWLAVSTGIVAAIMALPVHPQQRVDRNHPWPCCFENV